MEGETSETHRWIHVLLKGERSKTEVRNQDLPEIDKYISTFAANSLEAITIPILEFNFKNLDKLSRTFDEAIEKSSLGLEDVGIVLTSPRVVDAISRSLTSRVDTLKAIDSQLVFVVGERTGFECSRKLGIEWNKDSSLSGNSASLSEVIRSTITTRSRPVRLIYAKSSLADRTIEEAVSKEKNVTIESVLAYETIGVSDVVGQVSHELRAYFKYSKVIGRKKLVLNFIFFSPSGVECLFKVDQREMSTYLANCVSIATQDVSIKYSCIGRTTENCLRKYGASVHCLAEKPSAQSLVDVILLKCPVRDSGDSSNVTALEN